MCPGAALRVNRTTLAPPLTAPSAIRMSEAMIAPKPHALAGRRNQKYFGRFSYLAVMAATANKTMASIENIIAKMAKRPLYLYRFARAA